MKKLSLPLAVSLLFISSICLSKSDQNFIAKESFFIQQNKGQIVDQQGKQRSDVLFAGNAGALFFYATKHTFSYQLFAAQSSESQTTSISNCDAGKGEIEMSNIQRVDYEWHNPYSEATAMFFKPMQGKHHYYNVPGVNEGIMNVERYKTAVVKNLWKGIDWHLFDNNGDLEHEFILQRAEDFRNIKFSVKGASVSLDEKTGSITLSTPFGNITEGELLVFQRGKKLPAKWVVSEGNVVSVSVEGFISGEPMIVDPHVRSWGTYFGGTQDESLGKLAVDKQGNIYLCGRTASNANIASTGAHQTAYSDNSDIFLARFNPDGVLQWATYYGGLQNEFFSACGTDTLGNVFLIGDTRSATNIATPGSYMDTIPDRIGGGIPFYASFVAKFDSTGNRQWATYYGGRNEERANEVAVEPNGTIYLAGSTSSDEGIATMGSYRETRAGTEDAFIAKFDANGHLIWGTYYGGGDAEYQVSIKLLSSGKLVVVGTTTSFNLPTDSTAHQELKGGGTNDGFIAVLDTNGINLIWNTYYGGAENDFLTDVVEDGDGNLFFSGYTASNDSIATAGAFQETKRALASAQLKYDGFLLKMNAGGERLWATYFGGTNDDLATSLTLDAAGNINIIGHSRSTDLTMTDCLQCSNAGLNDVFLAQFSPSGQLVKSTYLGGPGNDFGRTIVFDSNQGVIIHGLTASTSGIATQGSHQAVRGGMQDAFIIKLSDPGISVDVAAIKASNISVYPNPAADWVFLEGIEPGSIVSVIDVNGRVLMSEKHQQSNSSPLPISKLSAGIYFVLVETNKSTYRKRLVVQR